jgi:YD repeat-containing protein
MVWREESDASRSTFAYDALGHLARTTGPNGATIFIDHDELGNKIFMDDPDRGQWHYRHNAFGDLVCQIDEEGNAVRNTYNALGALTLREDWRHADPEDLCEGLESQATFDGQTEWTYQNNPAVHAFGQVLVERVSQGAGADFSEITRTFEYDILGRIVQVATGIQEGSGFGSLNHSYTERTTYDQFGRVFQQFDATSEFDSPYPCTSFDSYCDHNQGGRGERYLYNERGYLRQVREARHGTLGQAYWTVHATDARGNVVQGQMGNGMTLWRAFDPVTGELTHMVDQSGSGPDDTAFNAWAVLDWTPERGYLMRSNTLDGRYGEFAVQLSDSGFVWGTQFPGGQIRYTMRLTPAGEWHEQGEYTRDGTRWFPTVEMRLRRTGAVPAPSP